MPRGHTEPVPLHIPPQRVSFDLRVCGTLTECLETWNWNQQQRIKRGPCSELFSQASRLRMLREIAQINWNTGTRFSLITLTYPDQLVKRTMERQTVDRSRFVRDLERTVGRPLSMLWRKEWKPRLSGQHQGQLACHWHLLAFGIPWVAHDHVRALWRNVLAHGGNVATDIREAPSGERAAFYASKYCAKASSCSLDNVSYLNTRFGRPWGFLRKTGIVYYKPKIIRDLSPAEFALVKHLAAASWKGISRNAAQGFSLFGPCGDAIYRSVMKMRVAKGPDRG